MLFGYNIVEKCQQLAILKNKEQLFANSQFKIRQLLNLSNSCSQNQQKNELKAHYSDIITFQQKYEPKAHYLNNITLQRSTQSISFNIWCGSIKFFILCSIMLT